MSNSDVERFGANYTYLTSQYRDATKVGARFAEYDLEVCEPGQAPFDPELEIVNALMHLGIARRAAFLDMGTSDGHFTDLLQLNGYTGKLIGIDPNSSQFNVQNPWLGTEDVSARQQRLAALTGLVVATPPEASHPSRKLLVKANANEVPVHSQSLDVYSMQNMLYHLSDVDGALIEASRALKETGIGVISTSGALNKAESRDEESAIAARLTHCTGTSTAPPPKMNEGFTTEKAANLLPHYWPHVYLLNHEGHILLRDAFSKDVHRRSHYSLQDQYSPVPPDKAFREAVEAIAIDTIGEDGRRIRLSRSVFLVSQRALGIDTSKFRPVA